jgi:cobalamin synthase
MSQVQTAAATPRSRIQTVRHHVEAFLRDFEWTWTSAVLFVMALLFFLLITSVIMPSWWMYYAEQVLGWQGPTDLEAFLKDPFNTGGGFFSRESFLWLSSEGLLMVRDAIAMGLTTGPIVTVLVIAAVMQNWRRRLRGESGDVRPTGGYR